MLNIPASEIHPVLERAGAIDFASSLTTSYLATLLLPGDHEPSAHKETVRALHAGGRKSLGMYRHRVGHRDYSWSLPDA